jgi:hypothetical protein
MNYFKKFLHIIKIDSKNTQVNLFLSEQYNAFALMMVPIERLSLPTFTLFRAIDNIMR